MLLCVLTGFPFTHNSLQMDFFTTQNKETYCDHVKLCSDVSLYATHVRHDTQVRLHTFV